MNYSKCNRIIPCTERYGIETVPTEIKNSKSLEEFKMWVKSWFPKTYPFKICKLFIKQVGYLNYGHFFVPFEIVCLLF